MYGNLDEKQLPIFFESLLLMALALPALLKLTEWEIMSSDVRNIKSGSPGMINFAMFSDIRYLYHSRVSFNIVKGTTESRVECSLSK